jgi:hypothetical protein
MSVTISESTPFCSPTLFTNPQAKLHVVEVCEGEVLSRRAARGAVVPIDAEEGREGHPLRKGHQHTDGRRVVKRSLAAWQLLARQEDRTLSEDIPSVHEDGDPIHGKTKEAPEGAS